MRFTDYREILKDEFLLRRGTNPSYSLRAFARDLNLAAPKLSQIMSGKCGLSPERAQLVAAGLRLNPEEVQKFCTLVKSRHARSRAVRTAALSDLKGEDSRKVFSATEFGQINHWHFFAVLSLLELRNAPRTQEEISVRLGLPLDVIRGAIEKLQGLGLIVEKSQEWHLAQEGTNTPSQPSSRAIRLFHKSLLAKALSALDEQDSNERNSSALIVAIDEKDLPRANELISEFRGQMKDLIATGKRKTAVYGLTIQMFKLDEKQRSKT